MANETPADVEHRPMPRLFIIRHGETEWSLNGRHTGRSDIPLTANGVHVIESKADSIVGPGKLIEPANIERIFCSPRQRAQKTFELLFAHHRDEIAECSTGEPTLQITEDVREWDYGKFEGLKPKEILAIQPGWQIWRDGCPGGESVEEMTARIDKVIANVQSIHERYLKDGVGKRDIIVFSHGHHSRVFISRWMQFTPALGTHFNVEPGGVALLTYNHRNLSEPALGGLNLFAY
ncbi:phosphoglycerate mutase-like protein [Clavulina sp. PMI_390]|nr:phosphoglycerate mutase-like protein [Clavulina sp. PMI_390]